MIAPAHGWRSWPRTHPSGRNCLTPAAPILAAADGTSDDESLVCRTRGVAPAAIRQAPQGRGEASLAITVGELDKIVGEARGEPKAKMMMRSMHTGTSSHRTNQLRATLCYGLRRGDPPLRVPKRGQAVAVATWIIFSWPHESRRRPRLLRSATLAERLASPLCLTSSASLQRDPCRASESPVRRCSARSRNGRPP